MSLLPSNRKSFALVDLKGSRFAERHVKVDNHDGHLTVAAEKTTRVKKTGERIHRSFLISISDPELKDAKCEFKDGKLFVYPK
jgi:hypothetical protein